MHRKRHVGKTIEVDREHGSNSNGVIGKNSGGDNPCSGWRDDSPGHSFNDKNGKTEIPSHLNAWNKLGGVENVHLLYKKGLIVNGKKY